MAARVPVIPDPGELRRSIVDVYSRLACDPDAPFHLNRGADYAHDALGYDRAELEALPAATRARFSGVGNPFLVAPIPRGATILDHACGAGLDLLIAARRAGRHARAIGVDVTPAMRECAITAAQVAGFGDRVTVMDGAMEALPVADASIDIVISNAALHLAPDKLTAFREICRVLKPGGCVYLADVVVARPLRAETRSIPQLWAGCVAGAVVEHELPMLAAEAGLGHGRVTRRFPALEGTPVRRKLPSLDVAGVNFFARKPL
jgi:arsenite methyltransferase